jgi:acetyl-CoA acyltransferase 1
MLRRTAGEVLKKSPNDVVVLSAVRSPIARAFKGGFKDAYPEEILMPVNCLRFNCRIISDEF